MKQRPLRALVWLFRSSLAHADVPLTIEDLITDKGKLKLDLSVT